MKKQHDLEENIFGFVDISHRRYKLRRDVEQTPFTVKGHWQDLIFIFFLVLWLKIHSNLKVILRSAPPHAERRKIFFFLWNWIKAFGVQVLVIIPYNCQILVSPSVLRWIYQEIWGHTRKLLLGMKGSPAVYIYSMYCTIVVFQFSLF